MASDQSANSTAGSCSDTHLGSLENEEEQVEPETFLEQLISAVALEDVERINQTQKNMLNRFEKTNEMLVNCNALGQIHFEKLSKDYRRHTARLLEMHKDLDFIFHRVRFLKQKLKQKYPDVMPGDDDKSNVETAETDAETADQPNLDATTNDPKAPPEAHQTEKLQEELQSHSDPPS